MKAIRMLQFRCFENKEIVLKPGINLLIGDNGVGKTSLLKACKYVLSSFFSGFSDENTSWMGFTDDDFMEIVREGTILPDSPIQIFFDMRDVLDYDNEGEMCYLKKVSRKNSRMLLEGLKPYKASVEALHHSLYTSDYRQACALPLFACFSTEDIHSTRKINEAKFKAYNQKNSFGYYECLSGSGFFFYWIKRLIVLAEGQKNQIEIDVVKDALLQALGPNGCGIIADISVRPSQGEVYFIFADGREVKASALSDGYRRIANIIIDVAFRCILLNKGVYGTETCRKTKGTLLIDEIDMHLHPSLQSTILQSIHRAFPKIQIVATTHAPMVMSGVESNEENVVYKMMYTQDEGYKFTDVETYGMNVSDISDVVLNVAPRTREVDEKVVHLFHLIDDEHYAEARQLVAELRGKFGDRLPELIKADTMLNLMD